VSVDKVTRVDGVPAAPKKIYVQNFEVPPGVLRVDRGGKALDAFRKSLVKQLARETAKRVDKRLCVSEVLPADAKPPRSPTWMVSGRFLTVNQGSRALRAIFGLGAGGTKIETVVTVYDLSAPEPRPFLKFVTSGGSNSQPGAIFGLVIPNYWLLALDVVGKVGPGLNVDVIRTSREIVAVLSEYMAQEGFLSPAKVSRAKKLGQWP
jgi:hypothetical protein